MGSDLDKDHRRCELRGGSGNCLGEPHRLAQVLSPVLDIEQVGGIACHTGRHSCFFSVLKDGEWKSVDPVLKDPENIYK